VEKLRRLCAEVRCQVFSALYFAFIELEFLSSLVLLSSFYIERTECTAHENVETIVHAHQPLDQRTTCHTCLPTWLTESASSHPSTFIVDKLSIIIVLFLLPRIDFSVIHLHNPVERFDVLAIALYLLCWSSLVGRLVNLPC
jgi:hydrogenase-4 membrane subunit HyfE